MQRLIPFGFCFFASSFAFSRLRSPLCFATILIIALSACDRTASLPTSKPTVAPGSGIVRGVVKFIGAAPAFHVIGGDCCPGATPVMSEDIVVSSNGGLKNVVVFIRDGPNIEGAPLKDKVLAQKNCQYVPHVLALQTGQNTVVTSHDATLHNIHIEADANPADNFSESQNASHAVHFDRPDLVKFKCDVHAWMSAYAYVFDHPCFDVTDDDGKFEIKNLPAGTYTLVAWQERMLLKQMQITVKDNAQTEVQIEYRRD